MSNLVCNLKILKKIQFLLGPKKVPITAQILQLLERVYHSPGPGAAQPRSAVAIYRGGPLDYGVGKNYTTVFIIPGMVVTDGWTRADGDERQP